jgi:hypothetical protein
MDVVVQPGVNWVDLNRKIQESGLFLPLDPSPTATIGGMVSTNCRFESSCFLLPGAGSLAYQALV